MGVMTVAEMVTVMEEMAVIVEEEMAMAAAYSSLLLNIT
jgi:hypothetical protein